MESQCHEKVGNNFNINKMKLEKLNSKKIQKMEKFQVNGLDEIKGGVEGGAGNPGSDLNAAFTLWWNDTNATKESAECVDPVDRETKYWNDATNKDSDHYPTTCPEDDSVPPRP